MDTTPVMTPMQLLMTWSLLLLLLAWLIIFTALALRATTPSPKTYEHEESSLRDMATQLPLQTHTTSRDASSSPQVLGGLSTEAAGEVGAAPIA